MPKIFLTEYDAEVARDLNQPRRQMNHARFSVNAHVPKHNKPFTVEILPGDVKAPAIKGLFKCVYPVQHQAAFHVPQNAPEIHVYVFHWFKGTAFVVTEKYHLPSALAERFEGRKVDITSLPAFCLIELSGKEGLPPPRLEPVSKMLRQLAA
jgi:hypothetical protein